MEKSQVSFYYSAFLIFDEIYFFTVYRKFGDYKIVIPGKISPKNDVPDHICKPSYALTGIPCDRIPATPEVKDGEQIGKMREACFLASKILKKVECWLEVK